MLVASCTDTPGEISRDTKPFDDISATTHISMLGTEPFWGIDITPDGEGFVARYTSPEDLEGSQFAVSRFAGNNGIGFSGSLDGKALQIALTPGQCSDGMSDRTYPYTATVALGDAVLYGCGHTSDQPFTGDEAP
ncbi:membrane protein [Erythrobacter sp. Dej080120_24]|uniref:COG3650 family protein n=1 Tax=Erythrobacter sp. Dej080120_24 TaxID=3024837 RepID=UPI000ABAFF2C|nr:membrane protein [Erythrobacter sp. Dej080120_24]